MCKRSATHDCEESRHERGDEVLAGPGADDGVVRPRDGGPVVGRDHEAHLEEGAGVGRQAALEPWLLLFSVVGRFHGSNVSAQTVPKYHHSTRVGEKSI